jgi:spore coat protein CotH
LIQGRFGEEEDGNLFKGDPRGTLEYRGDDAAPYKQMYELETNESADNWTDLIRLSRVLNTTPTDALPGAIEPILDVEGALSLLALDNYTVNLTAIWVRAQLLSVSPDVG